MGKQSKLFLIFEPSENSNEIGLKDDEPSWMEQLIVGAISANSIQEAVSSLGGKLETRKKEDSIVWLPEKHFLEVWQSKEYQVGKVPEDIETGFETLLWKITPTKTISLGLISPLRKRRYLGLAIREIPLIN